MLDKKLVITTIALAALVACLFLALILPSVLSDVQSEMGRARKESTSEIAALEKIVLGMDLHEVEKHLDDNNIKYEIEKSDHATINVRIATKTWGDPPTQSSEGRWYRYLFDKSGKFYELDKGVYVSSVGISY